MAVHLICGDSAKLVNDKIKGLIGDNKAISFDMLQASIEEVVEEAATFSLFADRKYLILKNSHVIFSKITDSNKELFIRYLQSPNDLTTLILVSSEVPKADNEIYKAIKANHSVTNIKNPTIREIYTLIEEYFKENNLTISKDMIYYIINNSLNNYDMALNEAKKIVMYYSNKNLKKTNAIDIQNIVYTTNENNIFHFTNEVLAKNLDGSLELLNSLKLYKVEPVIIFASLAKEIRNLYNVKFLTSMNYNVEAIASELGLKDWQIKRMQDKMYLFKEKELKDILLKLGKLDYDYKRGQVPGYTGLELLLISI